MATLEFILTYLPSIVALSATVYVIRKNHRINKNIKPYL